MRISNSLVLIVLSAVVIIVSTFPFTFDVGFAFGVDDKSSVYSLNNSLIMDVGENAIVGSIVINEVQYNAYQPGVDSLYEWFELYNTCNETVTLVGWNISDNSKEVPIPSLNVSSYGFVVIAASENFPDYVGTIVFIKGGRIGNGLSDAGDRLILKDGDGDVIDELSYGTDNSISSPPCPGVIGGHSIERSPVGYGDFIDNATPTPGYGIPDPTSTPTPTPNPTQVPTPTVVLTPVPMPTLSPTPEPTLVVTPTPTVAPTQTPFEIPSATPEPTATPIASPSPVPTSMPTVVPSPTPVVSPTPTPALTDTVANRSDILVNEIMYDPKTTNESDHEWVELYNTCDETMEVVGWNISDNKKAKLIPSFNISPHGFAIIAASTNFSVDFPWFNGSVVFVNGSIGNGLNNDGDRITLNDSAGTLIDEISYGKDGELTDVAEGHSLERQPAGGSFIDNSEPTPGFGLLLPAPTPMPTPSPVPSPTATSSPTTTANPTSTPTPSVSPTPTNVPQETVANRSAILINEVQGNPLQSGSDASYEWIELFNPGTEAVELIGWGMSDNYETDEIPSLNVSANAFAIIATSENFSINFPNYNGTIAFIVDGRIGNGLGNAGDRLVLKDSAGTVIDEMSYGDDESVTSPSYPNVADGQSLERAPCGGLFIDNEMPTPGRCLPSYNQMPALTPSPTLISALTQTMTESNSSDSISTNRLHSTEQSRSVNSMAHKSSSLDPAVESPVKSLRSLLITLSSALIVILAWTLYRRKAR